MIAHTARKIQKYWEFGGKGAFIKQEITLHFSCPGLQAGVG